jgi:ribose transport system permease protein
MQRRALLDPVTLASRYGAVLVLAAMVAVFAITLPSTFPTSSNFKVLFAEQAVAAILALGVLLPIVAGEFDFSAGAVLTAATVATVKLTGEAGLAWPLAVVVIVVAGALIGSVNGALVAVGRFNSFVATLATSGVIGGIALMVSGGQTLFEGVPASFLKAGRNTLAGVPLPIVYAIVVFLLVGWLLRQTAWGRRHETVGKGRRAAELAGVPVRRHVILAFMGSGCLGALAGVLLVARLGSSPPDIGQTYILSAFAAVFLGAAMLRPGFFNATGTILAIVLIAIGVNGLSLAGVSSFVGQVFTGVILLLSVGLSRMERRGGARRRRADDEDGGGEDAAAPTPAAVGS